MQHSRLTRQENQTITEVIVGCKPRNGWFYLPRYDASVHAAKTLELRLTALGWGIMYRMIDGKPDVHCIHWGAPDEGNAVIVGGESHIQALCQAALTIAYRMKVLCHSPEPLEQAK